MTLSMKFYQTQTCPMKILSQNLTNCASESYIPLASGIYQKRTEKYSEMKIDSFHLG